MPFDDTQVYIKGVLYQQDAYPTDATDLFNLIDESFRQISGFKFNELLINRSECRFSNGTTREQLLIFFKDIMYTENSFLTDTQSTNLRNAIINKLDSLTDISYNDVEIRTSRVV